MHGSQRPAASSQRASGPLFIAACVQVATHDRVLLFDLFILGLRADGSTHQENLQLLDACLRPTLQSSSTLKVVSGFGPRQIHTFLCPWQCPGSCAVASPDPVAASTACYTLHSAVCVHVHACLAREQVGFELMGDLRMLANSWPSVPAFQTVRSVFEMRELWVTYLRTRNRPGVSSHLGGQRV